MYLWTSFLTSYASDGVTSQSSRHMRQERTRLSPGLVEEGGHDALQDPDLGAEAEGEQHHEEEG